MSPSLRMKVDLHHYLLSVFSFSSSSSSLNRGQGDLDLRLVVGVQSDHHHGFGQSCLPRARLERPWSNRAGEVMSGDAGNTGTCVTSRVIWHREAPRGTGRHREVPWHALETTRYQHALGLRVKRRTFPAPLGPMTATNFPGRTSRDPPAR